MFHLDPSYPPHILYQAKTVQSAKLVTSNSFCQIPAGSSFCASRLGGAAAPGADIEPMEEMPKAASQAPSLSMSVLGNDNDSNVDELTRLLEEQHVICYTEHHKNNETLLESPPEPSLQWMVTLLVGLSVGVDALAYSIITAFLPAFAAQNDISDYFVGLSFSAFSGGAFLSYWPAALAIDAGCGGLMMVSASGIGAAAALAIPFFGNTAALMAGRLMQGVASGANWTAALALLVEVYGPEELGPAAGSSFFCGSLGTLVGPIVGGALFTKYGGYGPMGALAGLCLLDGVLRIAIAMPVLDDSKKTPKTAAASSYADFPVCAVWRELVCTMALSAALHVMPAILSSHAHAAGLGSTATGSLFMVQAISYGIMGLALTLTLT